MKRLAQGFSTHGLKVLIVIKLAVLAYVGLDYAGLVTVGDKPAVAQEPGPTALTRQAPPTPETTQASDNRKSFLQDLLELPTITPETVTKEEITRYLELIETKNSQVEQRLRLLETREAKLNRLEDRIAEKLNNLQEEMSFFEQTLQKEKELNQERLDKLITFYRKMNPKKAAPVFEELDRDLVVALFNAIPQKQTTEILSLMNPEKAVELSEYYGRLRSAKEYELLRQINADLMEEFQECRGMPNNERMESRRQN